MTTDYHQSSTSPLNLIGIFVAFALMVGGFIFVAFSVDESPSPKVAVPVAAACVPIQGIVSDKTVVLRVDDVQAYSWVETTKRMVVDAGEQGIPLSLGVIPVGLKDDVELVGFLKDQACRVEFALHGLAHSFGEDGLQIAGFSCQSFAPSTRGRRAASLYPGATIRRH